MKKYLIALCLPFLAACSGIQAGASMLGLEPDMGAHELAQVVAGYCDINRNDIAGRQAYVEAVNASMGDSPARITAFDCDGDGRPDF